MIMVIVGEILKKKLFALLMSAILLTGCTVNEVSNKSVSDIFETILYTENNLSNTYLNGYSLYLPHGVKLLTQKDYNLVIKDNDRTYYLYADIIGYYYKRENTYQENSSHFYSKKFTYNGKSGYIDVTEYDKDYYFAVVMYNYTKIETYVKKNDFDKAIISVSTVLSSVKYNDSVISRYVDNNGVVFKEEEFNLLEPSENDNFLKYEKEFGTYKESIVINNDDVIDVDDVID